MTPHAQVTSEDNVLLDSRGSIAIVTINRAERRNALNASTKTALRDTLETVAADDAVRAVVLTGAGRHFCVGQDLGEHAAALAGDPTHAFDTVDEHYSPIIRSLATMAKPVIAAVEGSCVGAGLGFALACDIRVVSTAATMSTAFSAIGLTCDSGLAYTLPRAVGLARARELVLLGEPLDCEQADRYGLVTTKVEPGEALEIAIDLAAQLAAGPTRAYAESKTLVGQAYEHSLDDTLIEEARAQARLGLTADHRGAVEAFLAKQHPTFNGC